MFIRTTKTHTRQGKTRYSHRLVRTERSGGKVTQKTLLNLGVNYPIPKEQWKQVADCTESMMLGYHQAQMFDDTAPEIIAEAKRLVSMLRARGIRLDGRERSSESVATVDLDTLDHTECRYVGCERLCLGSLEELGFGELLRSLGVRERDSRIAQALVVAKMAEPSSEREACRWLKWDSAVYELLGIEKKKASLSKLYRITDMLWKHREEIQRGLFEKERELLGLGDTVVFYDLTNVHYTGRPRGESKELLRFGRSKQKRNDCPLVTVAMTLDATGFPRGFEVLAGNVSEPKTLEGAMKKLEDVCGEVKPTVIMDAGIATEENIQWLCGRGYEWICVNRGAGPEAPEGPSDIELETTAGHRVWGWKLEGDSGETFLYALSEGKKMKEDSILGRFREKYEEDLRYLDEGLSIPGRMKRYEKVVEKVGRLKEKYSRVSEHYEVRITRDGRNAGSVRFTETRRHEEESEGAGSYVLRTSHGEWSAEKVIRTYWRLSEIEATFRSLKSELGLRPIWHSAPRRIAAHLFIAFIAYHGVHLIRTRLRARGIELGWDSIRRRMRRWVRVSTTVQEVNGDMVVNRQDSRPDVEVEGIANAFGIGTGINRRRYRM